MRSRLLPRAALLLAGSLAAAASPLSAAAHITVVNTNQPGIGFNDPTAATPVGGNSGTTVGQQRLIAFQYAADLWASLLTSNVEIRIQGSFVPLTCTATTATIGSATPIQIVSDFPGEQFSGTWYTTALANKRAGQKLIPSSDDIRAMFNSNLGQTGCLEGTSWYYGLDDKGPAVQIDLVNTLLHEFGHGLGFLTVVDPSSGQEFMGQPDVFERNIFDPTMGGSWVGITDAQRAASAVDSGHLAWNGPNVTAQAPSFLSTGTQTLQVNSPAAIAGRIAFGSATFGPAVGATTITGPLIQALDPADSAGPSTLDACSPLTNAPAVAGKIAFADRGTCPFVTKAKNAQNAGAIALIVDDNVDNSQPFGMLGTDPTITIPSVGITKADGDRIKANLASGISVSLLLDTTRPPGRDSAGRVLLYAPNPVVPGSSISHWDTSATPDLLMEPNDTPLPNQGVDLTLPALLDIGWGPIDDSDDDGVVDSLDNCPSLFNPGQEDSNHNGVGNACERTLIKSPPHGGTRVVKNR
jgi:hypothetical protein